MTDLGYCKDFCGGLPAYIMAMLTNCDPCEHSQEEYDTIFCDNAKKVFPLYVEFIIEENKEFNISGNMSREDFCVIAKNHIRYISDFLRDDYKILLYKGFEL